jgi:hypothetical protein
LFLFKLWYVKALDCNSVFISKKKKKKKKKFPKYGSELSATPTKSAGQARGGLTTPEAFFMWKDSMECLKTLLENDLSENSQKLNRQGEREG